MAFLHDNVGPFAFAKWRMAGGQEKRMSTFNAAVYDAVAVGLAEVFSPEEIRLRPQDAAGSLAGYRNLFSDESFFASVSGSVNDAAKVKFRIDAMVAHLLP
jgi:hypothetical protein